MTDILAFPIPTTEIDGLPAASALTGAERLVGRQSGIDVRVLLSDIIGIASNATQGELDALNTALTAELTAKAADSAVVHDTGDETVAGVKTFTSSPIVPSATTSGQAVNKSQLDAAVTAGGSAASGTRPAVKVASVGNQAIGLLSGAPIIDTYQTADNDRVLLTGQTNQIENGLWIVNSTLGWSRPSDFAAGSNQAGAAVFVSGGAAYKASAWTLTSTGAVTVGTTAQAWYQDTSAVRLSGNQTITGVKTFSSSPVVPDPTTAQQAASRAYVTRAIGLDVGAPGGTDDTALVNAAKTAAGANGTIIFSAGTYVVTGLTASVAGQHWIIQPGATVKLKNAANTPIIDVTASGVTIDGGGTLDGNRANQTATAALDAVQGNTAGVRAIAVDKCKVRDLLIKDTGVGGVFADNVTNLQVRNNHFTGCGQSGNYKVVMVYYTTGSSTGVRISGNVIDGSARGNGCIGISLNAASRVVSRIRITGNECIIGNAGATATLGIELFTGSGAAIRDCTIANNVIIGTAGSTPYNVYGISVGGTTTGATLGCSNVSVTGNTVRDCNLAAIELVGSGVTCSGNTIYNSGFISVAAASPMTGGLRASTVTGNTLFDTVGAAYAIHISGNTDGLNGVTVTGNVIHNPEGAAIGVDGAVARLVVADNVVTSAGGPGFYTDASATVTDSTVSGNTFDLTGSPANQDGILLASTGISKLKIIGNTITGASRYGIYGLAATTAVEVLSNTITGCNQGLRTDAGAARWIVAGNHIHDNTDRGIIFFVAATNLLEYSNTLYANPGGDYYHDGATTFANFVVNGQVVTIP